MTGRYETHKNNDDDSSENYYDGIIDTKNDNQYICNWHSIMRMLNQYEDRLEHSKLEIEKQSELLLLQSEKIRKLEELLMLRKLESNIDEKYKYEEL